MAFFCHATLFLCGIVTIGTEECGAKGSYKLAAGVAVVSVRALLLRPFADVGGRLFICEPLDVAYVKQVFPQSIWKETVLLYYIIMIALLKLTTREFSK